MLNLIIKLLILSGILFGSLCASILFPEQSWLCGATGMWLYYVIEDTINDQ